MEEVPRVEDMDDDAPYKCPVLKVFRDIKGRRAALIKALTTDVEVFYQQCDPEKENLCLYGYPNEEWRVDLPVEELPSELPEPVLGINFRRDEMDKNEWLSLVAAHSNAWLLAVAFYLGARAGFDRVDRNHIFNLINNLPTLLEVVTGTPKKQLEEKSSVSSQEEDEEEVVHWEFDGSGEIFCEACGDMSPSDDFWICCDSCEMWFHGECVKVTPAMLEHIKHYKCQSCSYESARP